MYCSDTRLPGYMHNTVMTCTHNKLIWYPEPTLYIMSYNDDNNNILCCVRREACHVQPDRGTPKIGRDVGEYALKRFNGKKSHKIITM